MKTAKYLYPDFKNTQEFTPLPTNDVSWLCPNCGQWTNVKDWICCCSRECLKQWLDSTKEDKKNMSDNELIAEFMGAPLPVFRQLPSAWRYQSSWNDLMPVVEKIHTPEVIDGKMIRADGQVTIFYKGCEIEYSGDEDSGCSHGDFKCYKMGETKIEAVYKAVVEFIKWYNSQTALDGTKL